jgi:hypothetical protein
MNEGGTISIHEFLKLFPTEREARTYRTVPLFWVSNMPNMQMILGPERRMTLLLAPSR